MNPITFITKTIQKIICEPRSAGIIIMNRTAALWPDKLYIRLKYWLSIGKWPNIKNPKTFNEKLQWQKLNDRCPEYTVMVDKVKAKDYVASKIGEEYIIPTLGVWERAEDVDFDALPDKFVIKCNHNSGKGMYICKDKSKMDVEAVRRGLAEGLRENYFLHGREWPYKNVPRRIIAEQFMEDSQSDDLKDFKIFCFDAKPEFMYIASDRNNPNEETKFDFFDMDFNHLPFTNGHPNAGVEFKRPEAFEEMKQLAAKLSEGIPHVRVDFFEINGKVYFGELTFSHMSGMAPFIPEEWDERLGKLFTHTIHY